MAAKKTQTTTIRLPKHIRARTDVYLKRNRLSLNELAGLALTEYLDHHESECPRHEGPGLLRMDEIDIRLLEEILQKEGRDE
ncbi:hypothetical protein [Nitrosovibrio sp. Nv6]|uniref:hypothetical protein n=1 Tax=Nitrosovibrio sp. Nv6 TaxID=1855340 RepID=UPI0008ADD1B2|nr:hypothetical protein [Nitrosovibrio sp. Nv6]SEO84906.1 hypothetical protein SAMN05216316_1260 [Nitrosovibrio sp. Nv6]